MAGMNQDELGGLANRLAMLVSDDGEADNAGRAVGALARRMGLSGGQLKAIFMAGAETADTRSARLADQAGRIRSLEEELEAAHAELRRAEQSARAAQRERDAARAQADKWHDALDRSRTTRQSRLVVALLAALVVLGGAWFVITGMRPAIDDTLVPLGVPAYASAVVRDQPTALHRDPDTASPTLAVLAQGSRLKVRRTFWHSLMQWVEVEIDGRTGYVRGSEVSLS